ncbi:MAG: DUF1801 domain-containing protein [Bacteroidota bacterium]
MQSTAPTPKEYLDQLPDDRKAAMKKLRSVIRKNLPRGFAEVMNYGMIGYVVPHTVYPDGYHCDPKQPLPFINIASQKNFIAVYHMGIYAEKNLLAWFTKAYTETKAGKLDMGKGCLRFKKPDQIPYDLIGELARKMTPKEWIAVYEKVFKR